MKKIRLFLANVGTRSHLYPLVTPPLGCLYMAGYLRNKFPLDIMVVNQRMEKSSPEELAHQAIDFDADVVGLGSMTVTSAGLPIIVNAIRAASPKTKIFLGGPHASSYGPKILEQAPADAAVSGEGELSMEMLLEAMQSGSDFAHIPGLMWRDAAGNIITNPGAAPFVQDLDSLPMPAYDLIDIRRYWRTQSMPPVPRRKYISLLSSRGCPYHCMWCHNIFGRRFRAHSAARIVDEITHYKKTYGIDDIEFVDDAFNIERQRVFDFSEELLRRNGPIKIAFPNAVRADLLDDETVDALVQAGAYFSSFALESGTPRIQELTGKRLNIPNFLRAVELATSKGIFANGFMMLGFPTETEEEMKQTIRVATDSQLHTGSFFTVTPFPSTGLFDYAKEHFPEKMSAINYADMNLSQMRVNMSAVSDEMLYYYQRKAVRTFFSKPSRMYRILRDFPQPERLIYYSHIFLERLVKGLF